MVSVLAVARAREIQMKHNRSREVRFTKHAREKFEVVKHYGFEINEKEVVKTIQDPARVDQKGTQYFAIKAINAKLL